jgi:6-pyruvoyltetrahydropterin/6-carboxytetrahydropterin synthase
MHEIYLETTFDAGHRVVGHKGKCANLHGHTYRVQILAESNALVGPGFVVDFGDLKDVVNEWDHKLLLWEEDRVHHLFPTLLDLEREGVLLLPFNPTAESMAEYLAKRLVHKFVLTSCQVTVWETPKASASYQWRSEYEVLA